MNVSELTIEELVKTKTKTLADLAKIKRKVAKKYKISCLSNIDLLKAYHKMIQNKRMKSSGRIEFLLRTRPIRSLSGIVNVSVLTKPYPCPGKCIYCPNRKEAPKSYLPNEPAVMRAILNNYNPCQQVKMRLRALENEGHPTDKIELRIIGGTWSFYPKRYQTWFIKRCFDACNEKNGRSLEMAQKLNEKAKYRIVGLSIETRPDFINLKEIRRLRKLGVTMVELGVQSIYDDVLKLNQRGHGVESTIKATKFLKNAGFKVLYQMMLNLAGSNLKRDRKMFEEIFKNSDFQPDLLKIYPAAILKGTILYQWWKEGKYRPYSKSGLINLVKSIKKKIPYYVRIQRITRDIPSRSIAAGPAKISNLRQILAEKSKKEGWRCKCIRCREVRGDYDPKEKLFLFRQDYNASEGREIFLSFEDKNRRKLYGLLRLRIPDRDNKVVFPTFKKTAIIREVHIYGQLHPLSNKFVVSPQHKGLGKKLIKEAEKIIKSESNLNKIAVIAGVGTRNYYRKLKYKLKETYMVKKI